MRPSIHAQHGFTLVEAIIVITITGVLAGVVAVFIRGPIESYIALSRRADLSDVADTAVRRITRDIHLALSNSVRNPGDSSDQCIEFIPTKSGGRYRAAQSGTGTGDILDFSTADGSFDMLGLNADLPTVSQIAANDIIVVYNDGSTSGNAYTGANAIAIASLASGDTTGTTKINFVASGGAPFVAKQLPSASPNNRFQVLPSAEQVVAYACSAGSLLRYSRKLTAAWAKPANCVAMAAGATAATLATGVTACSLVYQPPGSGTGAGRFGIVSISLAMTQSDESANLYHQVKVDNTP